jgi:hypothetical protein
VMPRAVGRLVGWEKRYGYHESDVIWGAVSLSIMWTFWRERNNSTVNVIEFNRHLL